MNLSPQANADLHSFSAEEGVAAGTRRIIQIHVSSMKNLLRAGTVDANSLQSMRQQLQQIRSILHLIKREIGNGRFRQEENQLKAARQFLLEARDGVARVRAFDHFIKEVGEHSASARIHRRLVEDRERWLLKTSNHLSEIGAILERFNKRVLSWELDESDYIVVIKALGRTYRHGRETLREYLKTPNERTLYTIKAGITHLGYQLHLSQNWVARSSVRTARAARQAREISGLALDYTLLKEFIWGLTRIDSEVAISLRIEQMRNALTEKAKRSLVSFYQDSPGNFMRRICPTSLRG